MPDSVGASCHRLDDDDDVAWLVSSAAHDPLQWVCHQWADAGPGESRAAMAARELSWLTWLRKHLSPVRAGLVVETVALRRKARTKFPLAEQMFFTAKGLEQATQAVIAAYKAARFPTQGHLADVCCGIGGDLLALASHAESVLGIERDPGVARRAAANLRVVLGRKGASSPSYESAVLNESGHTDHVSAASAWHIDPDRRSMQGRVSHPSSAEPQLATIQAWHRMNPNLAVKLAPSLTPDPNWWGNEVEWEWIGLGRHCQQLVAWCGSLAQDPGHRVATLLDASGRIERLAGLPGPVSVAGDLGDYLIEPHAVVLAAHLSGLLAKRESCQQLGPDAGYLTGSRPLKTSLASSFRILEAIPFDRKRLRAALRARRIGQVEVKSRGPENRANQLAQELRDPRREAQITLILVQHQNRAWALLTDRVK